MGTATLSRALATNWRDADLSDADRAMLSYAVRLTREPHSIDEESIDELRRVGFVDAAILDICQVVSYYNYVNRLADGLGVEMEAEWEEGEMTLTRDEFEEWRVARARGRTRE